MSLLASTVREALPAPELLSTVTPAGLEVFQVTSRPDCQSNVFYNYDQAVAPDSRFVLLNRTGEGTAQVLLCDLEDGFALSPANEEATYQAATFTRDGLAIYYSVLDEERLLIRRRGVGDEGAETVFALDRVRPEFGGRKIIAGRWICFSHDGLRCMTTVAIEGVEQYYSMAVFTFDMQTFTPLSAFEVGPNNWNSKNQYAPCLGPEGEYLLCACNCFSRAYFDENGQWRCDNVAGSELGGAEYLLDEDGQVKYAYPVGRDRPHQNVSHWAWFGKSLMKVFHADTFDTTPHWRGAILLAAPVRVTAATQDLGRHAPGARQLDLTRHVTRPDVWHLCVDAAAQHLVCDTYCLGYEGELGVSRYLFTATVEEDADGPYVVPRYLLNPHSTWSPYGAEAVPCFTPDRKWILFNSDYNGVQGYRGARHTPQVFAVRGMTW